VGLQFVTEPTVWLVAETEVNAGAVGEYLDRASVGAERWPTDATSDGDFLAEFAGRICYHSFGNPRPGGNAAYLERIKDQGHGSVLEHATYTLLLTGVSRSLLNQLTRHRAGFSYSVRSQRFCDESDAAVIVPPILVPGALGYRKYLADLEADPESSCRLTPEIYQFMDWLSVCRATIERYREKVARFTHQAGPETIAVPSQPTARRKAIREAVRSILPECLATEIVVTANARAWRHFLEMRGPAGADAEIRRLALAVLSTLEQAAPNLFSDYRTETDGDGFETIATDYRKV